PTVSFFPYTTLFRSLFALTVLLAGFFWSNVWSYVPVAALAGIALGLLATTRVRFVETTEGLFYRTSPVVSVGLMVLVLVRLVAGDRKSTRLNSSHVK